MKTILKALKGVSLATPDKTRKDAEAKDITTTAGFKEAMADKRCGRVYQASSAEDMFKQILG